ncbi:MAG: hypothetical protein OXI41_10485 [Chloroflexota bacterium]|nr:hypothetical protein [Chloroflexota bacterium]MDE2893949.1 hypothetical protein [Chloroflexota bacterium]
MDESKGPLPLWKLEEVLLEAQRELVKQMDYTEEQARRIVEEVARPQLEARYVIDRRARRP